MLVAASWGEKGAPVTDAQAQLASAREAAAAKRKATAMTKEEAPF